MTSHSNLHPTFLPIFVFWYQYHTIKIFHHLDEKLDKVKIVGDGTLLKQLARSKLTSKNKSDNNTQKGFIRKIDNLEVRVDRRKGGGGWHLVNARK